MFRAAITILFAILAMSAQAQETPRTLSVSATAHVSAAPDIVTVTLGVDIIAKTAGDALAENSQQMAVIFATLADQGVAKTDVQTTQLSLYPRYNSSSASKAPGIDGFQASNMVMVRVRDLPRVGEILDALAKAGANRIQSVQFGIIAPEPLVDEARKRSVAEALRKANLYAEAAGVTLGDVLSMSESGGFSTPMPMMEARMASDAVPIAEGELSLSATVNMIFEIK